MFKTFLQIFTRRLCEYEPDNVEKWMEMDMFPTAECMEVCRQWRNYGGEALLMEKFGDGRKAISIYLSQMDSIDQKRMIDQLFALGNQAGNVGKLNHFEFLGKFDTILKKAAKIAGKVEEATQQLRYGEDACFMILEFLNKYKSSTRSDHNNQPR